MTKTDDQLKAKLVEAGGPGAYVQMVTGALDGVHITYDKDGDVGTVRVSHPRRGFVDEVWVSNTIGILTNAMR